MSATQQQNKRVVAKVRKHEHVHYPFWFGGSASCFAACVTHPLDLGEWGSIGTNSSCRGSNADV